MTIWIPKWPVQRRLVERPELRRVPLLVCRREPRGVMTVVAWAWAAGTIPRNGIPCGMSLAETLAAIAIAHGSRACRMAEIDPDDPDTDRAVLEGIARWCRRFAPIVAVESAERPECIHVDITHTASLFGGEESVVRTTVWTLASRGVHATAAVADTPAAARAAAMFIRAVSASATPARGIPARGTPSQAGPGKKPVRRRWCVVPPGEQATQLSELPVRALERDAIGKASPGRDSFGKHAIGESVIAGLSELGVTTIGRLLRLPRKSLASRFGEGLERRVAEFLGTREEPLDVVRDDAFPRAECRLAAPAATLDAIRSVIDGLVGRCVVPLAARGLGITAVQVRLEGVVFAGRAESPPVVIDIGLFRPSTSVKHLVELVELRLSRMHLPGEVESIAVEVIAAGAVTCRQKSLFGERAESDASSVERLCDRLAGRLGRRAVFEPKPVVDAQPEHAWMPTPPAMRSAAPAPRAKAAGNGFVQRSKWPATRPIWLSPQPVRLETVSVVPDGPPVRFRLGPDSHRIVDAQGPERIETAWWRGECVRRDYYVVETESGSRWWLFRRLRDGAWFLHGQFA